MIDNTALNNAARVLALTAMSAELRLHLVKMWIAKAERGAGMVSPTPGAIAVRPNPPEQVYHAAPYPHDRIENFTVKP